MRGEIDLRLLKIIHTMVVTGSAGEAARILKVSQSTISYMLKKARHQMGTHLFVRTRYGMKPCALAVELSQKYLQYMNQEELPTERNTHVRRAININTNTLTEMTLAATWLMKKTYTTPFYGVFHAYEHSPEERKRKLIAQAIDIDIGNKLPDDKNITTIKLFTSRMVILKNNSNNNDSNVFQESEWRNHRHVVSAFNMEYYNTSVEGAAQAKQLLDERDVAIISGSLINMVSLCAYGNYVMLIPAWYGPQLEKCFPVKCLDLPPGIDIYHDCYLHFSTAVKTETPVIRFISDIMSGVSQYQKTET